MFEQNREQDLKLLYKIFSRDPRTLDPVIREMGNCISARGNAIVRDQTLIENFELFTKALLDLKKLYDVLIENSFANNPRFQKARDTAFETFMNQGFDRTPQYLAQYADLQLRVGFKGLSNDDIDQQVAAIVRLFCLMHNRDMILKLYQMKL